MLKHPSNTRVAVGFSGGVDSSVTVSLLQKTGYEVVAVQFDQLGHGPDPVTVAAAERLGVQFEVLDLKADFDERVQKKFIEKLKEGKTPNPCILCNPIFKFGLFSDLVREKLHVDKIATGHYARSVDGQLKLPKDLTQDQTYFLSNLSKEQLEKTIFPLGEYTKEEVRELALGLNLPNAKKKSSTDVCFLEGQKFENFVAKHVPQEPGNIVELETGNVVGRHSGLAKYTSGQRKNLGVGGIKDRPEMPWFAIRKDFEKNELLVSQNQDALNCSSLKSENFNWIAGNPPAASFDCESKIRFRSTATACHVEVKKDGVYVEFKEPVRSVVAGQQVALYDGDVCLGGGEIS